MKKFTLAAGLLIAAFGLACTPLTPFYTQASKTVWLDQGWSAAQRDTYHHIDQGTFTLLLPYEWFAALEQPSWGLTEAPPFADQTWLDRFGFIPGKGALPVGFAHAPEFRDAAFNVWTNPGNGATLSGIGLTCAACHTGRLTYQGTEYLIDGGSALTDVVALNTALATAMHQTGWNPARFSRFAARVLGANNSLANRLALREQLVKILLQEDKVAALELLTMPGSPGEGFGRLDALNRIGNQVFALDMGNSSNYRARSAPVAYPHIWTAPWFTWVQYNGSIMQPMVRNAGEAMGVGARINLNTSGPELYNSTIRFDHLQWIEKTLAGPRPPFPAKAFSGLNPPAWPATLPPIDRAKAAQGAALYASMCQGCHLPPTHTQAFWRGPWWTKIEATGETYLDLVQIPLAKIGTDPGQAAGMKARTVQLNTHLNLGTNDFATALGAVVEKAADRWYARQNPPLSPAARNEMNGARPNTLQTPLEYKARPLNGIWATPPFLHNGSIPTIHALLSPMSERPTQFYLGDREYDPVNIGYRGNPIPGASLLDTAKSGNHNTGHLFTNETNAAGKIGRGLTETERMALIEYLKTL